MSFAFFISYLILLRLIELIIAKRNEKWLIANGAVEYGKKHYPLIVLLHILFILSLIIEYLLKGEPPIDYFFLLSYFVLIVIKIWVIASLGKYWNTKIFRIPGSVPVRKGPYNYIAHPNYIIVVCEIILIPLIFQLYFTAVIFTILNAIMLSIRIKEENKVWK